MRLSTEEFLIYWDSLEMIEHQEMLRMIKASQFPHLKKEDAEELHKFVYKIAHPKPKTTKHDPTQIMRILNGQ